MSTEIHHQKDGVLVLWAHTCGHLSNSMWYASAEKAEAFRAEMEATRCYDCRRPVHKETR
jgi:hypothetical protein